MFGIKTSWLAVRDHSPDEVADRLELCERETLPWEDGIDRSYVEGVYVAAAVRGWTIAHGRRCLAAAVPYGATDPGFLSWLSRLSADLGEVQFFANERGWSYHAWAWAVDGVVVRAYAVNDGAYPLFVGDPTPVERQIGKGLHGLPDGWTEFGEAEWDEYIASTPREFDVLAVAEQWSINPNAAGQTPTGSGIYGLDGTSPSRQSEGIIITD